MFFHRCTCGKIYFSLSRQSNRDDIFCCVFFGHCKSNQIALRSFFFHSYLLVCFTDKNAIFNRWLRHLFSLRGLVESFAQMRRPVMDYHEIIVPKYIYSGLRHGISFALVMWPLGGNSLLVQILPGQVPGESIERILSHFQCRRGKPAQAHHKAPKAVPGHAD